MPEISNSSPFSPDNERLFKTIDAAIEPPEIARILQIAHTYKNTDSADELLQYAGEVGENIQKANLYNTQVRTTGKLHIKHRTTGEEKRESIDDYPMYCAGLEVNHEEKRLLTSFFRLLTKSTIGLKFR